MVEASELKTTRLLGRGIYDVVEVARLVHRHPSTIKKWTTSRGSSKALLEPEIDDLYSFFDLISLHVISELVERGVPKKEIQQGGQFLTEALGTERPFAHRALATVGKSFFAVVGTWVDVGLRGQAAFEQVIEPLLRPIEYDTSEMAAIWRPHDHVWLNPQVQAGAPCLDGRRIPTAMILSLVKAGEDEETIAEDYELPLNEVKAALNWEQSLEAA